MVCTNASARSSNSCVLGISSRLAASSVLLLLLMVSTMILVCSDTRGPGRQMTSMSRLLCGIDHEQVQDPVGMQRPIRRRGICGKSVNITLFHLYASRSPLDIRDILPSRYMSDNFQAQHSEEGMRGMRSRC